MKPVLSVAACVALAAAAGVTALIKTENKPFQVGLTNTLVAGNLVAQAPQPDDGNDPPAKLRGNKEKPIDDVPRRQETCREGVKACDIKGGRDVRVNASGAVERVEGGRDVTVVAR